MPPELPISPEDWTRTPKTVQALLIALWEEVQMLRAEVAVFREQLGQTSQNSSRPPSTDPPDMPKPKRKPSGRKRGGQPGHEGVAPVVSLNKGGGTATRKMNLAWTFGVIRPI